MDLRPYLHQGRGRCLLSRWFFPPSLELSATDILWVRLSVMFAWVESVIQPQAICMTIYRHIYTACVLSSALRKTTLITPDIFTFLGLIKKHQGCRDYLLSHFTVSVHRVGGDHARVSEEAFRRSPYPNLSLRSLAVPLHLH